MKELVRKQLGRRSEIEKELVRRSEIEKEWIENNPIDDENYSWAWPMGTSYEPRVVTKCPVCGALDSISFAHQGTTHEAETYECCSCRKFRFMVANNDNFNECFEEACK